MAQVYLYTQPFSHSRSTPFWNTVKQSVQFGDKNLLFITATRRMQNSLERQLSAWRPGEGLLPEIITLDDLASIPGEALTTCEDSYLYLVEKGLLDYPNLLPHATQSTLRQSAESLYETYIELQRQTVSARALAEAYRQTGQHAKTYEDQISHYQAFLEASKTWPFPSRYQHYQTVRTLKHIQHKTVFILGFWELPPYQHQMLKQIVSQATLTAIFLHYTPLSPVYEAAAPFYNWLRKTFPDLREVYSTETATRAPVTLIACDSPSHEIQIMNSLKTGDTGILLSETDPYAQLLHDVEANTDYTGSHTHPLGSFLLALLDPDLPQPHALSRLLSHTLVAQKYPGWHAPQDLPPLINGLRGWSWDDWVTISREKKPELTMFLEMLKHTQNTHTWAGALETIETVLDHMGYPLLRWPAALSTVVLQALNVTQKLSEPNTYRTYLRRMLQKQRSQRLAGYYGKFESHLVQHRTWIMLGCRDGSWPKNTKKNYFLPYPVLRQLGLPETQHYRQADTYLFHAALHQATEHTYVLYPKQRDDVPQSLTCFLSGWPVSTPRPLSGISESTPNTLPVAPQKEKRRIPDHHRPATEIQLHTFSPTQLELYQACPYRFYLKEILRLPESNTALDIGPSLMGEITHRSLQKLTEHARHTLSSPEKHYAQAVHEALLASQSRYGLASLQSWLLTSAAWKLMGDTVTPGILPETYRALVDSELPIRPIAEEIVLSESSGYCELNGHSFVLKGRIDALYAIENTNACLIIDYKTGSKPYSKKDLETYRNLQLPLYMFLAQRQFPDKQIVGAAIVYARQKKAEIDVMALTEEGRSLLNLKRKRPLRIDALYHHDTLHHTAMVINSIREGRFRHGEAPIADTFVDKRKDVCRLCDYRWLCDFPARWEGWE